MKDKILVTLLLSALILTSFTGCVTNRDDYIPFAEIIYQQLPDVNPNLISMDIYIPTPTISQLATINRSDWKKVIHNIHLDNGHLSYQLPDNNYPVMIWVHGGGWRSGDKTHSLEHKIPLFINTGWIFVTVNYRLSPYDIPNDPTDLDPNRIKYPTHNQDVAAAIAWVYENINQYGGNPDNISLMGHSAGAAIVSSIGTNESYLAAHDLNLSVLDHVVSLDTAAYDINSRIENRSIVTNRLYMNAFGTDSDIWYDASPINHISSGKQIPSFFIVVQGSSYRIDQSHRFISKLNHHQIEATLLHTPGYDHSEVNKAIGNPDDTLITPALRTFLDLNETSIIS